MTPSEEALKASGLPEGDRHDSESEKASPFGEVGPVEAIFRVFTLACMAVRQVAMRGLPNALPEGRECYPQGLQHVPLTPFTMLVVAHAIRRTESDLRSLPLSPCASTRVSRQSSSSSLQNDYELDSDLLQKSLQVATRGRADDPISPSSSACSLPDTPSLQTLPRAATPSTPRALAAPAPCSDRSFTSSMLASPDAPARCLGGTASASRSDEAELPLSNSAAAAVQGQRQEEQSFICGSSALGGSNSGGGRVPAASRGGCALGLPALVPRIAQPTRTMGTLSTLSERSLCASGTSISGQGWIAAADSSSGVACAEASALALAFALPAATKPGSTLLPPVAGAAAAAAAMPLPGCATPAMLASHPIDLSSSSDDKQQQQQQQDGVAQAAEEAGCEGEGAASKLRPGGWRQGLRFVQSALVAGAAVVVLEAAAAKGLALGSSSGGSSGWAHHGSFAQGVRQRGVPRSSKKGLGRAAAKGLSTFAAVAAGAADPFHSKHLGYFEEVARQREARRKAYSVSHCSVMAAAGAALPPGLPL